VRVGFNSKTCDASNNNKKGKGDKVNHTMTDHTSVHRKTMQVNKTRQNTTRYLYRRTQSHKNKPPCRSSQQNALGKYSFQSSRSCLRDDVLQLFCAVWSLSTPRQPPSCVLVCCLSMLNCCWCLVSLFVLILRLYYFWHSVSCFVRCSLWLVLVGSLDLLCYSFDSGLFLGGFKRRCPHLCWTNGWLHGASPPSLEGAKRPSFGRIGQLCCALLSSRPVSRLLLSCGCLFFCSCLFVIIFSCLVLRCLV
jgi:hypothetical protein